MADFQFKGHELAALPSNTPAKEQTMLRKHCCGSKCFPVCGPRKHFLPQQIRPFHTAAILSRETKKALFTTPSLAPMVPTARLGVVKQSFFGLPGQYGRRVTRANDSSFARRGSTSGNNVSATIFPRLRTEFFFFFEFQNYVN